MSAVIRMALQDGEPTVKLLQQHYARQFMREGNLPKGKNVVGGGTRSPAPAISRTNRKEQFLRAVRLVILKKVRNLLRSELPATGIEQHQHRLSARCALLHQLEQRGLRHQFQRVTAGVARKAFQILGGQRLDWRTARPADPCNAKFHGLRTLASARGCTALGRRSL